MASTSKCHGHLILPRVYWVLPILHTQVFFYRMPLTRPYKEKFSLVMGQKRKKSLRNTEDTNVPMTHTNATRLQQTLHTPH